MISTLLFDLDGTLLDSDMAIFLPPYFRALARRLAPVIPPSVLDQALTQATRAVLGRRGRDQTNEELFWREFLPRVGRRREEIAPLIQQFYDQDFPNLQCYTKTKPEARQVMASIFASGYSVAIATQPIFPLTAIVQRLRWAEVDDFPYALITCLENMHSTKPDPAYFHEICTMIERWPAECLMVGNDPQADLYPAAEAGMQTFWITDRPDGLPGLSLLGAGTLWDLCRLLLGGKADAKSVDRDGRA